MVKPRVLLVQPSTEEPSRKIYEYRRHTAPPLGLMYVAAVVREAGYPVKIVDRNIESEEYFEKVLREFKPTVLGTNAITGYMIIDAIKISKQAMEMYPNLVSLWGGTHPSLYPEQTLREPYIHYLVNGEGEDTFMDFLKKIEKGETDMTDVKGLVWKKDGKVIVNPPRPFIESLDNLPFLPWDLVRAERYMEDGEGYLFTSRGCPYRCQFCYTINIHKRSWRKMSAERVIEEFRRMNKIKKINRLKFVDDLFTTDVARFEKIMAGLPAELRIYLEVRVNYINQRFVDAVKKFKDVQLLIGVESGNNETLKKLKKDQTAEMTVKAFKLLNENNIASNASVMIGFPWETMKDCKDTVKFLRSLKPTIHHINIFQPFPGTPMFDELVKEGKYDPPKSLEEWGRVASENNAFMNLAGLPQKDLEKLRSSGAVRTLYTYIRKGRYWDLYNKVFKYFFKEQILGRKDKIPAE